MDPFEPAQPAVASPRDATMAWTDIFAHESPAGAGSIFPDHLAGRLLAVVALAGVIRRLRTGEGGHASVAQADTVRVVDTAAGDYTITINGQAATFTVVAEAVTAIRDALAQAGINAPLNRVPVRPGDICL